ncbi:uncharacterized protein LOC127538681 [Antechinus flavipes]|uniref:uncharacterized protein LOC127538681 n=1 Tax=Antechinus flavipes TaxID=38775 RepID=UPI002236214A|nr:uncharacterized protein LOC127538681 [Antechinus flavipes]
MIGQDRESAAWSQAGLGARRRRRRWRRGRLPGPNLPSRSLLLFLLLLLLLALARALTFLLLFGLQTDGDVLLPARHGAPCCCSSSLRPRSLPAFLLARSLPIALSSPLSLRLAAASYRSSSSSTPPRLAQRGWGQEAAAPRHIAVGAGACPGPSPRSPSLSPPRSLVSGGHGQRAGGAAAAAALGRRGLGEGGGLSRFPRGHPGPGRRRGWASEDFKALGGGRCKLEEGPGFLLLLLRLLPFPPPLLWAASRWDSEPEWPQPPPHTELSGLLSPDPPALRP